jgi:GT2 family glycosyltransferase
VIYTHIAYAQSECEGNIGCAYNKIMESIPHADDWVCFLDHDAMFTTDDWTPQLQHIINKNKDVGAFGARTNRVGYSWQLVGNIDIDNNDIKYHREIGGYLQKTYYDKLSTGATFEIPNSKTSKFSGRLINEPRFSGTLILVKKKTWSKIGGFKTTGFLEVDDDFRKRLSEHKIKFAIMDGVYVYHWYRADDPYKTSAPMLNRVRTQYTKFSQKNKFDLDKITLLQ